MFLTRKTKENNSNSKSQLIIGSFLMLIGIGLVGYNMYDFNRPTNLNKQDIELFWDVEPEIEIPTEENEPIVKQTTTNITNYIALLEIPSINLINGLVDINSKANKVNKNIEILKPSDMPDVENGHLILAAHSGSGKVAYFRNLHKLKLDDEVIITYNKSKYVYKIIDIYDVEKTGKLKLKNYWNKSILTMITCLQKTNKQIIVISELIDIKSKGE